MTSPEGLGPYERWSHMRDHVSGDGHGVATVRCDGTALRQLPVHFGGRFSANAMAPSLASFDMNTGARIFVCSRHISSGLQPRDSTMMRFVAATASGPFAVIFSASAIAASSTWPASAGALTL